MTVEVIVAKNRSRGQKGLKWPQSTNNAKMAKKSRPKKTTVAENDQKVQKGPKRDSKGPEDSILPKLGRGPKSPTIAKRPKRPKKAQNRA